ncbi:MAG: M48 family metalloprotease [Acidimicrobiales bacterium]
MRTRAPVSEAHRAEAGRYAARRAETRRVEQVRVEALRADQMRANCRRAALFAATPGVLVGFAALAAAWAATSVVPGLVVGLVVGGLVAAAARLLAVRLVMRLVGAVPAGSEAQPRTHNLLDGLCPSAGVTRPQVWVLDHQVPNAMVVAANPARARLILTTGLLDLLNRVELEGVLAQLLMHLRSGDAVPATIAVATGRAWFADRTSRGREEAADLAASSLTCYPRGLAASLERLSGELPVDGMAARLTARLWLASPGTPPGPRAAALREL